MAEIKVTRKRAREVLRAAGWTKEVLEAAKREVREGSWSGLCVVFERLDTRGLFKYTGSNGPPTVLLELGLEVERYKNGERTSYFWPPYNKDRRLAFLNECLEVLVDEWDLEALRRVCKELGYGPRVYRNAAAIVRQQEFADKEAAFRLASNHKKGYGYWPFGEFNAVIGRADSGKVVNDRDVRARFFEACASVAPSSQPPAGVNPARRISEFPRVNPGSWSELVPAGKPMREEDWASLMELLKVEARSSLNTWSHGQLEKGLTDNMQSAVNRWRQLHGHS